MRGHLRRAAAILAVLAVPVPSEAAVRISLAPVRGDTNSALTKQLRAALCRDFECVPISRIRTHGKLDFAKVEALKVAGILAGTVAKGGRALEVALLEGSLQPVWRRSYPLTKAGTLSRKSTVDLVDELKDRLGVGIRRPPRAEEHPPIAAAPPPAAAAPPLPPAAPPPSPAPPRIPSQPPAAAPSPAAVEPGKGGKVQGARLLAAVEAGVDLAQRKLSYQGIPPGISALHGLEANLIVSPRFRLEFYPVALLTEDMFAGIGLFAGYAFSVGLTTLDPAGGAEHPTSYTRLGTGLLWRLYPTSSSRFALIPSVSYQALKFTVGGDPIPGLPDADLSGLKLGIDAEIPVGGAVTILLGAGYVKWTTALDLLGDGFFPGDRAYALEADAGVSVALGGRFSLRLLAGYSGTQYSLESSSGGAYQATGATDRYLGLAAMLRAQF